MSDVQNQVVIADFMNTLDFEGVDPKDLFLNFSEEGAQKSFDYVNSVVQSAVVRIMQAHETKIMALETETSSLQDKIAKLQQEKEELSHDLGVANLENSDLQARVTNASRLLDEEKAEVSRLNSQVDDLRKEIAVGAAAAIKVEEVDVRSAHEKWLEQRQKEEEAKPIIYNLRWKDDIRRDTYLAQLAATDETIEIPYFTMTGDLKNPTAMKGRYRVVTSEDAPSFRTAALEVQEPEHSEEDHSYDIPDDVEEVAYTIPQFQTDSAAGGLATEASAVAGSPVSREEFETLAARVYQLEERTALGAA